MATKPFKGKDNRAEEMAEGRAVRAGKVSPAEYARRERMEGRKDAEHSPAKLKSTGAALASGRMSPAKYAAEAKMKSGGMVKGRKC